MDDGHTRLTCHAEPHAAQPRRTGVTTGQLLSAWALDPLPSTGILVAAMLYLLAGRAVVRRSRTRRTGAARAALPRSRPVAFGLGLLALVVALDGPPDVLSDSSFLAHMVQHLLLQLVAAPLLLLGGPVGVVLRADPPWFPRRALVRLLRSRGVRVLTHPVTALGTFATVLVGSHLTPLYELALRHEGVHDLEHLAYFVTALLFWWPAIGVDPAPHRMGHPARLLYLFLAMPVMAFLGVAIADSGHVLYASYVASPPPWGATPLADQRAAGTVMWVAGMFTVVPAMAAVLWQWLDEDSRRQLRSDERARQGRRVPAVPLGTPHARQP